MLIGGTRTAFAQGQVVFLGAALVAVAFDDHTDTGVAAHDVGLEGQHGARFLVELVGVEGEMDGDAGQLCHGLRLGAALGLGGQRGLVHRGLGGRGRGRPFAVVGDLDLRARRRAGRFLLCTSGPDAEREDQENQYRKIPLRCHAHSLR